VKNAIVQIDATPFKMWYQTHYGVELGIKGDKGKEEAKTTEEKKVGTFG
jgi:small subunit ribosomal protein S8e